MEGHLSDDPLYAFTEHDYGGRYDGFIPVPPGIGTECRIIDRELVGYGGEFSAVKFGSVGDIVRIFIPGRL